MALVSLSLPSCAATQADVATEEMRHLERLAEYADAKLGSSKHGYRADCDALVVDLVEFANDNIDVEADRFRCEREGVEPVGSIVYLIGGPYQDLGPFPEPYVASFLMAGYEVFVPRYSGTFSNTIATGRGLDKQVIEGNGELGKAAAEVEMMLRRLDDGKAPVILAGVSAGGYLAAYTCAHRKECTDDILMVSPLMQSPNAFFEGFGDEATGNSARNFIAYNQSNDAKKIDATGRRATSIGFYGVSNWDTSLCDLLGQMPAGIDVRIFYGDEDPRIGIGEVTDLEAGCGAIEPEMSSYPDASHSIIHGSADGERQMIEWLAGKAGGDPSSR